MRDDGYHRRPFQDDSDPAGSGPLEESLQMLVQTSRAAMAWLESPSATSASTSRSRPLSSSRGSLRRLRAKSRATIVGSTTVSVGEAAQRVDHVRDIENAFLEKIADPFGMFFEQPHGVVRLDVLGENQHANVRVLCADLLGGDQALVGMCGGRT